MNVPITSIIIQETESGWTMQGTHYETGAEAIAAVKQSSARLAEAGISNAMIVTWETTTSVGRRVAQALAA